MIMPIRDRKEQSAIDTLTKLGYEYVDDGKWESRRVPALPDDAPRVEKKHELAIDLVKAIGYEWNERYGWLFTSPNASVPPNVKALSAYNALFELGWEYAGEGQWECRAAPPPALPDVVYEKMLGACDIVRAMGYSHVGGQWVAPKLPTPSALAKQEGGEHYKQMPLQPWEIIERNKLDFWQGNVIKYTMRYKSKGGAEDLRKAVHYLEYLIERETR